MTARKDCQAMKCIISVDVEEDDWGCFSAQGHALSNIESIARFQKVCDDFAFRPTYLITYPVATDPRSIALIGEIAESGRCEIGMHCHPWNTPPYEEDLNEGNSMLCSLPEALQYRKLSALHSVISDNFGISPTSFRAGRFGYGPSVARIIGELGYTVDSSITPFTSWEAHTGPDFRQVGPEPYRFSADDIFRRSNEGALLEVPVSIGFLQNNFELSNTLYQMISKKWLSPYRFTGILSKLHLLNKLWLSPELFDGAQMIKLAERFRAKEFRVVNMFFHSTSLKAGLSPFTQSKEDEDQFIRRITHFLEFCRSTDIQSITLSETRSIF